MTENLGKVSIYEDAISHINTKSQIESNLNNENSQYEICIENKDYNSENIHVKIIDSKNIFENGQNKFFQKIKNEEEMEKFSFFPLRFRDENSFDYDIKSEHLIMDKNASHLFNSNTSRNKQKNDSANCNTKEGKFSCVLKKNFDKFKFSFFYLFCFKFEFFNNVC